MTNVIIIGAAGRMGRHLVKNVIESNDLNLTGAIDHPGCPMIGKDAGATAGLAPCQVNITSELEDCLDKADAVIDFSTGPVTDNAKLAVEHNCAVVIGTTAIGEDGEKQLQSLAEKGGKIVYAPNMSVGVNLLFHFSEKVAEILGNEYDIEIIEMHHNQKKDAPSGTAVRLGEILTRARNISYQNDVRHGREGITGARSKNEIGMHALRGGDVVGEHTVIYATGGERIELTHKASSRDTFAKGALRAVRYLVSATPGMYDMQDVLNLK